MALTTGPSQPEVQSFEPVGTTDMVDMFTGDFVYNIPLLDVEGYPVNISYHGNPNMEQEASWVGLGWNINPGDINHTVRGIPDDFNGDVLDKQVHIQDEKILRIGAGIGGEIAGIAAPEVGLSADFSGNVNLNNYKGMSVDFNFGGGVDVFHMVSAGINMGIGSQTGASIDYNAGLSFGSSQLLGKDMGAGVGVSMDQGYSTRSGVSNLNIDVSASAIVAGSSDALGSFGASIPVGVQNYVPVITNSSTMTTISGRIKPGLELFWCNGYANINAMGSTLHYNNDATRKSFGYLYSENADDSDILDFSRDKDGMFNKTMQYLPPATATYDIYSVTGQGAGGSFRPFRNDIGCVYDPVTGSAQNAYNVSLEGALGWNFELGGDGSTTSTSITSGPWSDYYRWYEGQNRPGSIYEKTYMKQGGELTYVDPGYLSDIGGLDPIYGQQIKDLPSLKHNSATQRDVRGNVIYYSTARDLQNTVGVAGASSDPYIISYVDTPNYTYGANQTSIAISRVGSNPLQRKLDQISEVTQLQPDGKRYVYGIPAMNNIQKEATFTVAPPTATDLDSDLVYYHKGVDDGTGNSQGIDHYFSSTITPSYVHSYLLTSVLSPDYVDVTGNGPTDDDLGSYTKFNYSLKETDYRWKAPFANSKAQYNPGFWADPNDDKGSYLIGSREQWVLHSIETKNYIAEFYTSKRQDAQGATDAIVTGSSVYTGMGPYGDSLTTAASSYKLDSIKLYNKHDRYVNAANAVPIKTVYFEYDYSLCPGVPNFNGSDPNKGKLTLNKIYFSYGNSQRSMISPYQFTYANNPHYDISAKDRWGDYKPNNPAFNNFEYPFVSQSDPSDSTYSTAWSLTQITLPSGGQINVNYEPDDYAYVQDQPATEMFMVKGVGNSTDVDSLGTSLTGQGGPNMYLYFRRNTAAETDTLSFPNNYESSISSLFFSFNTIIDIKQSKFEQVKGYAQIANMGVCTNNSNYGWILLNPQPIKGGSLNPITFTAINVGRYNLPQVLYPGSDPTKSAMSNVLSGIKQAFSELVNVAHNPVGTLAGQGVGGTVNLSKCFIRLNSPGMRKKGGGQRVHSLVFSDAWNSLAAHNEQAATYGKQYNYTTDDDTYGTISSGVASYEPMIGGDENPLRNAVQYEAQSGSNWPPNDPVDLYQEEPIGESFYPSPVVGYSKVTVTSIHSAAGRSSQGVDVYQFYTAKDFPAKMTNTSMDVTEDGYSFNLFKQTNNFQATQGYTFIFNDMHGKPKSVEHYVYQPQGKNLQEISYTQYGYNTSGGQLNNNVNCLVYDPASNRMIEQTEQLGEEADITVDTRQKDEQSRNENLNTNLNTSIAFLLPIPIPWIFPWSGTYENEFQSATATKIIQQYGILTQVKNYNEGALTIVNNEVFDPNTGQVVVSSVNNEFQDKQYNVNIPAYWGMTNMGPAYTNIGYQDTVNSMSIDGSRYGHLNVGAPRNQYYNIGDELLVSYDSAGHPFQADAFVMKFLPVYSVDSFITRDSTLISFVEPRGSHELFAEHGPSAPPFPASGWQYDTTYHYPYCYDPLILPRFPTATPGWGAGTNVTNVSIKVIRSGRRNMLTSNAQTYTMLDNPMTAGNTLKDTLDNLIGIKAKTYSDSSTVLLTHYIPSPQNDSLNPFALAEMGLFRGNADYGYTINRSYVGNSVRNAGLFNALSLWTMNAVFPLCNIISREGTRDPSMPGYQIPSYMIANTARDANWHVTHAISKWSPFGKEMEDTDAMGHPSTAVYRYNETLPVAVATNAWQGDVLAEGFEDYGLLKVKNSAVQSGYSPFDLIFNDTVTLGSPIYVLTKTSTSSGPSIVNNIAHTGYHSLQLPGGIGNRVPWTGVYSIPITVNTGGTTAYSGYDLNLTGPVTTENEYMPFEMNGNQSYILSFWIKPVSPPTNPTTYSFTISGTSGTNPGLLTAGSSVYYAKATSNIIDGWQQFQVTIPTCSGITYLLLPLSYYVDDLRMFPSNANMKSFVYHPFNEKLMATLDENNFATFYEYDQEGNLVRTKKETEKGIMTISESRSSNPKR